MKVFVTGSTGFLGSNLVRALAEGGYEVKALARSAEKAQKVLGNLDIEFIDGDLRDVPHFAHHLEGCDVLFHTTAYFIEYYKSGNNGDLHANLMHEINVEGTRRLLEAAVEHNVKNVIYVSSNAVLGPSQTAGPIDEFTPFDYDNTDLYIKSKIEAEEVINQFMKTNDIRIVLIRPAVMLGPSDVGPTIPGQTVIDFVNKKIPGVIPGGMWFVDARDVANAMIRSVDTGSNGEIYNVCGRYFDSDTFYQALEEASGVPAPRRQIAFPVAYATAGFMELISRITGKPAQMTRVALRLMQQKREYSSEKAIKELQVEFRPLEDTLRDQVDWLKANGYI